VRLRQFFSAIEPFLDGREPHEAAARRLYGAAGGMDRERLAIYGEFCRTHKFEALDSTFEDTRAAVLRLRGLPAWESLVEAYFQAHPMRHYELNQNGEAFPSFLANQDLPAWLAELADVEWWCWRTRTTPDDTVEGNTYLRIAPTVELRPYRHDMVSWLDAEERGEAPRALDVLVVFWREPETLAGRRENAEPDELAVLQAVHRGLAIPPALDETAADLREAGILIGV
jgi:hypothetical protein